MQGEPQEARGTNKNQPNWAVLDPHFTASLSAHRSLVSANQSHIPRHGNSNSNLRETQADVAPETHAGLTFRCLNPSQQLSWALSSSHGSCASVWAVHFSSRNLRLAGSCHPSLRGQRASLVICHGTGLSFVPQQFNSTHRWLQQIMEGDFSAITTLEAAGLFCWQHQWFQAWWWLLGSSL